MFRTSCRAKQPCSCTSRRSKSLGFCFAYAHRLTKDPQKVCIASSAHVGEPLLIFALLLLQRRFPHELQPSDLLVLTLPVVLQGWNPQRRCSSRGRWLQRRGLLHTLLRPMVLPLALNRPRARANRHLVCLDLLASSSSQPLAYCDGVPLGLLASCDGVPQPHVSSNYFSMAASETLDQVSCSSSTTLRCPSIRRRPSRAGPAPEDVWSKKPAHMKKTRNCMRLRMHEDRGRTKGGGGISGSAAGNGEEAAAPLVRRKKRQCRWGGQGEDKGRRRKKRQRRW